MEAAEAFSPPGEPCAELLAELVDHSLVVFGADANHRRYSMHETIRQFAQEQLRGSDQEADARERHARYYAELVAHAAENRTGRPFPERLRTVVDDHDNLRQAFEWLVAHDGEQALALSPRGEIVVDAHGATSLPGVFAAGDCTTVPYKQIVIAMGAGATAALAAFDHLIRSSAPVAQAA